MNELAYWKRIGVLLFSFTCLQAQQPRLVLPVGNKGVVKQIFYSPDKRFIATVSGLGNTLIWQAKSGKLFQEYSKSSVFGWSQDGSLCFNQSEDNQSLVVSEFISGLVKRTIRHGELINHAEWSPDGKRILTNSGKTLKIWDAASGLLIKSLDKTEASSYGQFSPDGRYIFITKEPGEGKASVLDYTTFKEIFTGTGGRLFYYENEQQLGLWNKDAKTFTVYLLSSGKQLVELNFIKALSDNGRYALKVEDNKIAYYDVLKQKILARHKSDPLDFMRYAVISPDGKKISVDYDIRTVNPDEDCNTKWVRHVKIFDTKSNDILFNFKNHFSTISLFQWSADSKHIISSDYDKVTLIWDAVTGNIAYNFSGHVSGELRRIKVSPDKKSVAMLYDGQNNFGHTVKTFSLVNGILEKNFKGHCYSINSLEWSSSGKHLLTGSDDAKAILWDAASGKKKFELNKIQSPVNKAFWTNDENKIITISGSNGLSYVGEIKTWNSETGTLIKNFPVRNNNVCDIALSPDGKKIVAEADKFQLKIWDLETGAVLKTLVGNKDMTGEIYWMKEGNAILTNSYDDVVKLWDVATGKLVYSIEYEHLGGFCLSPDQKWFAVKTSGSVVSVFNAKTGTRLHGFSHNREVYFINWSKDNAQIQTTTENMEEFVWDIKSGLLEKSSQSVFLREVDEVVPDKKNVLAPNGFSLDVNDLRTGKNKLKIYAFDSLSYFIQTPDNYYSSSRNALKKLSFRIEGQLYSFDQFDLKYNRPDIILERLGYADTSKIKAYNRAYLKRLKKMNFTLAMLKEDFHLPEVKIKNQDSFPPLTQLSEINLDLEIKDSKYKLDRILVYINDVPVFGVNGINLREVNTQQVEQRLKLELAEGENKIQISALNQAGAESYKELVYVTYTPTLPQGRDLYLITIGDSKYSDSRFNLTYAAKDAQDIKKTFEGNTAGLYQTVHSFTLTDDQVTKENVLRLKSELSKAKRNDVVLITMAGHGVLDAKFDYYLATYDMNFSKPEDKGLLYEELESLLDGIAPLRKVLFLDACHSGEVDKEEVAKMSSAPVTSGEITFRTAGVGIQKKNLGLKTTSELMSELFTDLRKGTGATIISSSGGAEFAIESDRWKNGLFTYCMLNGLTTQMADSDKDGKVMLSELQAYLRVEVSKLSNGAQQPTSRLENVTMDFRVW